MADGLKETGEFQCPEGNSTCAEAVHVLKERIRLREHAYEKEQTDLVQQLNDHDRKLERLSTEWQFAGTDSILQHHRLLTQMHAERARAECAENMRDLLYDASTLLAGACERQERKHTNAETKYEALRQSYLDLKQRADESERSLRTEQDNAENAKVHARSEESERAKVENELSELKTLLKSEQKKRENAERENRQLSADLSATRERLNALQHSQGHGLQQVDNGSAKQLQDDVRGDEAHNHSGCQGAEEMGPKPDDKGCASFPSTRRKDLAGSIKEATKSQGCIKHTDEMNQHDRQALAERDLNVRKRKQQRNNDSGSKKRRRLMMRDDGAKQAQADTLPLAFLDNIVLPKQRR